MLAKKYADHIHKHPYPLYVQPKLNGVRALYWQGGFQSRDEHFWIPEVIAHLTEQLSRIPSTIILDGELYVHGWSLQKINGAISVNRLSPNASTPHVQYHIFDCLFPHQLSLTFSERHEKLRHLLSVASTGLHIELVHTQEVCNEIEADQFYSHYRDLLYEGMMYRANVPYGISDLCTNKENRWDTLLKRKEWLDEDCPIIDVQLGTGKYSSCVGSLELRFPNGRLFSAGSGLSDLQRRLFMDAPPIGCIAKIKYEMLSDEGVPLKPTIEVIYD